METRRQKMTKVPDIISPKTVKFHLYGETGPGSARERRMVVPLLLARGKTVSRLELADWMDDDGDADDLDEHLAAFRRRLADMGLRQVLVMRDQVCRLTIPPELVDAHRLNAQVADAGQVDDHTAAERLRAALDLCAGEPLAGLTGRRIVRCRRDLREARLDAEIALMRVEFRLGRAEQHVPGLVRLSRERLADTEVVGLAVSALHRAGRQAEAADLYDRHREHLIELGMPVPERIPDPRTRAGQVESH
jgi:DNA-binding SARP family transcriptional activator